MIKIQNIDCMVALPSLATDSIDIAIIDPPYGIGWGQNSNNWIRKDGTVKSNSSWKNPKVKSYTQKEWDNQRPTIDFFIEVQRVAKKTIIWGGNYFTDLLPPSGGWLIWDKGVNENLTFSMGEMAWLNFKNNVDICRFLWSGFRRCEVVDRIHPTQKPVALYEWCINRYSERGATLLDTHMGSGSSAIAALRSGLDYVGFEIDKEYFDLTSARIKKEQRQTKLF
jgi:site-specific DNA-methyltransferase (adenine-specific)